MVGQQWVINAELLPLAALTGDGSDRSGSSTPGSLCMALAGPVIGFRAGTASGVNSAVSRGGSLFAELSSEHTRTREAGNCLRSPFGL